MRRSPPQCATFSHADCVPPALSPRRRVRCLCLRPPPLCRCARASSLLSPRLSSSPLSRRFATAASSPSAPSSSAGGGGGILSGLTGRLTGALEDRRAAAATDKFAAMVRDMLQSSRWTLEQQRSLMRQAAADAGVSGWKSWLPGVSSQAGVEELRRMLAMLDALTAEERADAALIDRTVRLRVAERAAVTVADVNFLLRQFAGAVMVHRWLHERRAKGRPMPTSQADMQRAMAADRPVPEQSLRHRPRRR